MAESSERALSDITDLSVRMGIAGAQHFREILAQVVAEWKAERIRQGEPFQFCPWCGSSYSDALLACRKCGAKLL